MLSSSIDYFGNMDDSLSLSAYREWIAAVDFLLALLGGGMLGKTALWCSRAWLSGSACRVSYVVNERVRSVVCMLRNNNCIPVQPHGCHVRPPLRCRNE